MVWILTILGVSFVNTGVIWAVDSRKGPDLEFRRGYDFVFLWAAFLILWSILIGSVYLLLVRLGE